MIIYGKQVNIRAIEESDLEIFRKAINSPELEEKEMKAYFPISMFEQKKWFYEQLNNTATDQRYSVDVGSKLVGYTNILNIDYINRSAWFGMKIFEKEMRNKGLGTDINMSIMRYAFSTLNIQRLETNILITNKASIHLFTEKCGWTIEGTRRKASYKNGEYIDVLFLSILKNEYNTLVTNNHYWG